jgi:hypothetical protein
MRLMLLLPPPPLLLLLLITMLGTDAAILPPPHSPASCCLHRPNLRLHHPRVRQHTLPPVQYCNILRSYYLYGRSLKRAYIMFPYMISKGVVEIVVAATLLDKVHISPANKTPNPFATPPQYLLR